MTDDRPTAAIEEIWRQYRGWALTSRIMKKRQNNARWLSLGLGLTGAALGTVAGQVEFELGGVYVLSLLAAVAVALAAYVGREFLTPDRETEFSRSRLLAEALKRETWRALMGVPPYVGPAGSQALREHAQKLLENTGLKRVAKPDGKEIPSAKGAEDYLTHRIDEQIGWYEQTAVEHQVSLQWYRRSTIFLGGLAVVLGTAGAASPNLTLWVPLVTTASAAVVALLRAGRIQDLVPLYQETAVQLRFAKAAWEDDAKSRETLTEADRNAALCLFVELCEQIMARENESWRAEFDKEEVAVALRSFEEKAREAAGKKDEADAGA